MSELRNRMIQDMRLAGLVEGTRREHLRAVRQLTAYYMVAPDRLSERSVEEYLLYVRDELGVAKGTFAPIFAGLKFFYLNTLSYDWPLFADFREGVTCLIDTQLPRQDMNKRACQSEWHDELRPGVIKDT